MNNVFVVEFINKKSISDQFRFQKKVQKKLTFNLVDMIMVTVLSNSAPMLSECMVNCLLSYLK